MFRVWLPETFTLERDTRELSLTFKALDAEVAEPGLLGDLGQRGVQAIDVHGFVTHITYYDLIFFIVTMAYCALFAL
jgi:hypothetical protein